MVRSTAPNPSGCRGPFTLSLPLSLCLPLSVTGTEPEPGTDTITPRNNAFILTLPPRRAAKHTADQALPLLGTPPQLRNLPGLPWLGPLTFFHTLLPSCCSYSSLTGDTMAPAFPSLCSSLCPHFQAFVWETPLSQLPDCGLQRGKGGALAEAGPSL